MTENPPRGATVGELAREIPGARVLGDERVSVRDVRHDSRDVAPGDLFVVRRGQHANGRDHVGDALRRGAVALAAEETLETHVPVVQVPDAAVALARMSSAVWAHPTWALEVIGITGTNGKTTTAWLVEHALRATGFRPGLVGTVAHRFGDQSWPALHTTPESDDLARRFAAMRDAGATHVVMEVSSIALSLRRVDAVHFRVAALTNVTQDHLDFHGTMAAYRAAKRMLFEVYGPGAAVLNVDDPVGRALAEGMPGAITYAASGRSAALAVTSGGAQGQGIDAEIRTPEGLVRVRSPLAGTHNVENILAAMGILGALGVSYGAAAGALERAETAPGRLERVTRGANQPFAVLVDYAHTPDALARVLSTLRGITAGRLVCVFGCGGDRDAAKRGPMGEAVARVADLAVLTTDNPRTEDPCAIAEATAVGMRAGGMRAVTSLRGVTRGAYVTVLDRREAIAVAVGIAEAGDLVLLAGKGHETYQEVHGVRVPFDDREVARAALAARGVDGD